MAVKKKAEKTASVKYDVEEVINRGGRTTSESKQIQQVDSEIRFTLRIPEKLIGKIDSDRETRIGSVSRNQWILEAIADKLS